MKFKYLFVLVFVFVFSIGLAQTAGAGFFCNGKVISEGATKQYVISCCGKPDFSEVVEIKKIGSSFVKVEVWTYDFGSNKLIQNLTFEGNVLISISNGGYGSK